MTPLALCLFASGPPLLLSARDTSLLSAVMCQRRYHSTSSCTAAITRTQYKHSCTTCLPHLSRHFPCKMPSRAHISNSPFPLSASLHAAALGTAAVE